MQQQPFYEWDLVAQLRAYQDACNRYDLDAAVNMFTDDGCIEVRGVRYCGRAALYAAHEYDLASRTQVTFDQCTVECNRVRCHFMTRDEVDRVVDIDGRHMRAEFTFQDGRIQTFLSLPPDEAEMRRHQQAKRAFFEWARQHYPDEVARGLGLDYETGASLTRVAHAWRDRQR